MPGVLVDSSSSSHHSFPFEANILSGGCFDGNAGFEPSSLHCDLTPISPHSPLSMSNLSAVDVLCSSPPSPSDSTRDLAQRFLPKSNLRLALSGNVVDASFDCPSELAGLPIPSPRQSFYNNSSADSIIGSPLFADTNVGSPNFSDAFAALHKFLPSNTNDDEVWPADAFPAMDAYSCDDFRMYEFKVRRCMRGRSHDWTECPFAHPGEKARRRDPRRIHYSGTACPDFRKGSCKRGDACEFAHGVFECWLHPARYRTQPCKDGRSCRRRVCFFAHTVEQLRVLPSAGASGLPGAGSPRKAASTYDGSPLRQVLAGALFTEGLNESTGNKEVKLLSAPKLLQKVMESKSLGCGGYGVSSSPTSTLHGFNSSSPPALSPPFSPSTSPPMSPEQYACWPRTATCMQPYPQSPLSNTSPIPAHWRHLNRLQTMPTISIPSGAVDNCADAVLFDDSPFSLPASMHASHSTGVGELLQSLQSLQLRTRVSDMQKASSTPSTPQNHKFSLGQNSPLRHCVYGSMSGASTVESVWALPDAAGEVQAPLRVESGRDLRAKIYGKIGKDNGVENFEVPDLGWVNELVK